LSGHKTVCRSRLVSAIHRRLATRTRSRWRGSSSRRRRGPRHRTPSEGRPDLVVVVAGEQPGIPLEPLGQLAGRASNSPITSRPITPPKPGSKRSPSYSHDLTSLTTKDKELRGRSAALPLQCGLELWLRGSSRSFNAVKAERSAPDFPRRICRADLPRKAVQIAIQPGRTSSEVGEPAYDAVRRGSTQMGARLANISVRT
jgi:hypothetical protein